MAQNKRKLGPLYLTAVIFLTVSGGPYGLEPLLTYAGYNGALLLLLITPLLWDIPTLLTVLELNSMMPVTGGYYQWVKKALGLKWAFMEGWWTWLYTFVDLAIYPVLFISYASFFLPEIYHYKIIICLIIIWSSAGLNILGVVPVGKSSFVLGLIVILPFLIVFAIYLFHHQPIVFQQLSFKGKPLSMVGMGLYTIMWNFIGWDNTTTYAEEVEKPIRTYLISLGCAFFLIFLMYLMVIFVSQQSGIVPANLEEKGFPLLGNFFGGPWLGSLIAIGGMASALGLYSAVLLSVSRVPEVMAEDGLLPGKLHTLHPKFNTPYISIIICSIIVSGLVFWGFKELLIIDITLYGAALSLEFISLIRFRVLFPDVPRPFRIRLNTKGLILLIVLPLSVYFIALLAAFLQEGKTFGSLMFAFAFISSGFIIWWLIKWTGQLRKNTIVKSVTKEFNE